MRFVQAFNNETPGKRVSPSSLFFPLVRNVYMHTVHKANEIACVAHEPGVLVRGIPDNTIPHSHTHTYASSFIPLQFLSP